MELLPTSPHRPLELRHQLDPVTISFLLENQTIPNLHNRQNFPMNLLTMRRNALERPHMSAGNHHLYGDGIPLGNNERHGGMIILKSRADFAPQLDEG
jgi:hypothetical protein